MYTLYEPHFLSEYRDMDDVIFILYYYAVFQLK